MPVIAMWETLDFRQSRAQPTEQNAEDDCRENSHHTDLVLEKALELGGHDIGVSTSWPNIGVSKIELDSTGLLFHGQYAMRDALTATAEPWLYTGYNLHQNVAPGTLPPA
jgi:hypothetical protein